MTRLVQLSQRRRPGFIATAVLRVFFFVFTCHGQQQASLAPADQTASAAAPQKTNAADDDEWHLAISPYLWFAGAHGTIGARGGAANFHANAADVLSKFNIGLMGAVEARKQRFVVLIHFVWIKLSDDKAFRRSPFPGITSIKAKATETIFTPKAGYRVVDSPKLQADALIGLRYWHIGENSSFQPSGLLSNYSQPANFEDVIAGLQAKADCNAGSRLALSGCQLPAQLKLRLRRGAKAVSCSAAQSISSDRVKSRIRFQAEDQLDQ